MTFFCKSYLNRWWWKTKTINSPYAMWSLFAFFLFIFYFSEWFHLFMFFDQVIIFNEYLNLRFLTRGLFYYCSLAQCSVIEIWKIIHFFVSNNFLCVSFFCILPWSINNNQLTQTVNIYVWKTAKSIFLKMDNECATSKKLPYVIFWLLTQGSWISSSLAISLRDKNLKRQLKKK